MMSALSGLNINKIGNAKKSEIEMPGMKKPANPVSLQDLMKNNKPVQDVQFEGGKKQLKKSLSAADNMK